MAIFGNDKLQNNQLMQEEETEPVVATFIDPAITFDTVNLEIFLWN